MNKEIPAELLKQIEDEAMIRHSSVYGKGNDLTQAFIEATKFALSLSPSSGEGEAVIKSQDEMIGRLTRENEYLKDSYSKRQQWLSEAKKAAGYDTNISFDVVWAEALKALLNSAIAKQATNTTESGQGVKTAEEILKWHLKNNNSAFDIELTQETHPRTLKAVISAMHEFANQGSKWISVEDRLPEFMEYVLVWGKRKQTNPQMGGNKEVATLARRQDLSKSSISQREQERMQDKNQFSLMEEVTHWQPLPKKPNE